MSYNLLVSILNNNIVLDITNIDANIILSQVLLDIAYINNIDLLKRILVFINKSKIQLLEKINNYFTTNLINHPLNQLEQIVLNLSNLNNKIKKMVNNLLNNNLIELINCIKFYTKNNDYYFNKIKKQNIYIDNKYISLIAIILKNYDNINISSFDKNNILIDLVSTNNFDILDGYLYYLKCEHNFDDICFDNININQNVVDNINNICIYKKKCHNVLFNDFYKKIENKFDCNLII